MDELAGSNRVLRMFMRKQYADALCRGGETNSGFRIYGELDAEVNRMLDIGGSSASEVEQVRVVETNLVTSRWKVIGRRVRTEDGDRQPADPPIR